MQQQSGAFPSEVSGLQDENCFVTASVALLLDPHRHTCALSAALDFVETCESTDQPGAFAFYPSSGTTPRLVHTLPPDADDTALAWLAMLRGRRRDVAAARGAFKRVIAPAALLLVPGSESPWVRPNAVRTWLADLGRDNPVDLAVQANVVALAYHIGLHDHPACKGACDSLLTAASGAYPPKTFARRFTPYYADITELCFAVRRAIGFGARRLRPVLSWLAPTVDIDALREEKPLYCNAHGQPVWRAPALQRARKALTTHFS